ncbi:MAG: phosphoribosylglycinamide formyltransferase [Oscillospiraceae bacterium]|nr:phosphoribosylglycinamide formyltransferase [Oscillospiraceae bacterium]
MLNIAVLVSGGGTNLQALIDAEKKGEIKNGKITLVISSKADVYALTRAENAGIKSEVISRKSFANAKDFDDALVASLKANNIDLVVLAGFMCILGEGFVHEFANRIINVHPSLIPSFCGDGFYGLKVHEKALEYGVKVTGATVHFVNEITDGGKIILQKAVEIEDGDTPETLQKRVMEQAEWKILPQAVSMFCEGKI